MNTKSELEQVHERKLIEKRELLSRRRDQTAKIGLLFTWIKQGDLSVKDFRVLLQEGVIHAEAEIKKD